MIKQSGGDKPSVVEISSDDTDSMLHRSDSFFQPILDGDSVISHGSQKGRKGRPSRNSQLGSSAEGKKWMPSLKSLQKGIAPRDPVKRKIFLEALSDPKIMRVIEM